MPVGQYRDVLFYLTLHQSPTNLLLRTTIHLQIHQVEAD